VTPGTALKTGRGRMGTAVACGGVVVNHGDIIKKGIRQQTSAINSMLLFYRDYRTVLY